MNHLQVDLIATEVTDVVDAVLDHGWPEKHGYGYFRLDT